MVILSNTIYITLWADYELASPGRLEQKRDLTTCREVGETPRNFKKLQLQKTLQNLSFR